MRKLLYTACVYTLVTALIFGVGYPLLITGIAHFTMRNQADGQLLVRNGEAVGSSLIGQPFSGPGYFHSRPSAAGTGYDASASSGSNLGPTSRSLQDRVNGSVRIEGDGTPVPIDLVTASGSGLDPDLTPAAALYQVHRVATQRHLDADQVRHLVEISITPRQFGLLGEPRVNLLHLNLALDAMSTGKQ